MSEECARCGHARSRHMESTGWCTVVMTTIHSPAVKSREHCRCTDFVAHKDAP